MTNGASMTDPLAALLEGRELGLCLDLASGRGACLGRLAALGEARAWLALDVEEEPLRALKAPPGTLLRLRADALRPPLRPAALDTAACSYSLHHLPRPAATLAAAARLLKPGGRLVLVEPLADGLRGPQLLHRELHHLAAALDRRRGRWHRPTFRLRELRRLLEGLPLAWRWSCWRPAAQPPGPAVAEVLETMARLDVELARGHCADLRRRLAELRRRVERGGYAGQTQFCAVGRRAAAGEAR